MQGFRYSKTYRLRAEKEDNGDWYCKRDYILCIHPAVTKDLHTAKTISNSCPRVEETIQATDSLFGPLSETTLDHQLDPIYPKATAPQKLNAMTRRVIVME